MFSMTVLRLLVAPDAEEDDLDEPVELVVKENRASLNRRALRALLETRWSFFIGSASTRMPEIR